MKLELRNGHISNFDEIINYIDSNPSDLRLLHQDISNHLDNNDILSSNDYDMTKFILKKMRNKVANNSRKDASYVGNSRGTAVASVILMFNAILTAVMFLLILISRL